MFRIRGEIEARGFLMDFMGIILYIYMYNREFGRTLESKRRMRNKSPQRSIQHVKSISGLDL